MASKERELLEVISSGKTSWGPTDNFPEARERFDQVEAHNLIEILDRLVDDDFIGDYITKNESQTGKGHMVRVHITKGLTFKGQDKNQRPS